jgi:hypothetical protein
MTPACALCVPAAAKEPLTVRAQAGAAREHACRIARAVFGERS